MQAWRQPSRFQCSKPEAMSDSDSDECSPIPSRERNIAAALLVVLSKAAKDGRDAMAHVKEVLTSNMPRINLFLQLLPDEGELPSLKQLAVPVTLRRWLLSAYEICRTAECQPLEMFTRSILCTTHLAAMHTCNSGGFALRQQRLQAIGKSLSLSVEPSETDKILMKLHDRVKILAQHGVGPKLRVLMLVTLHETMILLDFDSKQSGAASVTAGAASSFTACIDHILPGERSGAMLASPFT